MSQLIPVKKPSDIPAEYLGTPIEDLFKYQNFGAPLVPCKDAQMIVGMCMDNRKQLRIPENFAYIIRSGGANLRYSEFKISYAIAIGGLSHMALIGHDECGMVNLMARRKKFVEGLVEYAGWTREQAEEHFMNYAPMFEIGNETDFTRIEAERLNRRYPKVRVVPMFYKLDDGLLYLLKE